MGKCTKTIGERRLGRTINKLGNSVEFSSKEGNAKIAEQNYKQKTQITQGYDEDSPVQNLRDSSKWKKKKWKTVYSCLSFWKVSKGGSRRKAS